MTLQSKKIILGVTGSIAAYKAAHLTRLLVKQGAIVKVIMTEAAKEFVGPLTFSVLSRNKVLSDFVTAESQWNNHIELAHWADIILIAPISANTIAKYANGHADNLLLATLLSSSVPVIIAPAMDREMYSNVFVNANLQKLEKEGCTLIPAAEGELASGLYGEGRMAEPEHIIEILEKRISRQPAKRL
jgi:phosphopantothenoylcysteine decarboxylase / phosphopantothenate---cysteine ligase